jgi:hypothetical protein
VVALDGRLWVSYYDYDNNAVKIAKSKTMLPQLPQSTNDWENHVVGAALSVFGQYFTGLAVHDGKLALSYEDKAAGGLKIALAKVPAPSKAADWDVQFVDSTVDAGAQSRIISFSNRLWVSYIQKGTSVKLARSNVKSPAGPGDWKIQTVAAVEAYVFNIAAVQGRIAVSYFDKPAIQLKLARAMVDEPQGASDWSVHKVDAGGGYTSLVAMGSKLAVAYEGDNKDLKVGITTAPCF